MIKKPLPQFNSHDEAEEYYKQYGELVYFGRVGEYFVYNYHVRDGRILPINIYDNGKVELRE